MNTMSVYFQLLKNTFHRYLGRVYYVLLPRKDVVLCVKILCLLTCRFFMWRSPIALKVSI
jgi:hypothetical protein